MNAGLVERANSFSLHAGRTLLLKVGGAISTYGFVWFLARTTPPSDFGQVIFFLNLGLFGAVISARGGSILLVRLLNEESQKNRAEALTAWVLQRGLSTACTIVIVGGLGLYVGQSLGYWSIYDGASLHIGLALVPLVLLADIQASIHRARQNFGLAVFPKEILWRSLFTIAVLSWIAGGFPALGAPALLGILAACLALIILVQFGTLPRIDRLRHERMDIPSHWRMSATCFWISSVSNTTLTFGGVIMVGLTLGPKEAGAFFVANRLAMLLSFFSNSAGIVLGPKLSEANGNKHRETAIRDIRHASLNGGVPTLGLGAVLLLFGEALLTLFGDEFAFMELGLIMLVLSWIVNAVAGPSEVVLNMCGKEREAMKVTFASLVISIVVLPVSAIAAGPVGACFGVLVCMLFRKVAFAGILWKTLGVRTDIPAVFWSK